MKILVINGPNLNLLSSRDINTYGNLSLEEINNKMIKVYPEIEFQFFQSNSEGEIIDSIQKASETFDALIINPGGYAHSSVAIKDALEICKIPKVEVHISNLSQRESFRQNLITASSCNGYISGFRGDGYLAAIYLIKRILSV